jgi:5S rRNA maturation endonuclease (ribonuclease M5)
MYQRVIDIPLPEVVQKYLGRTSSDIEQCGKTNRHKTLCPFHKDSDPSLMLYDKTETGGGWYYHCYACGVNGTAPGMLTALGIAKNDDDAISMLMTDFDMKLPDKVDIDNFARFKGLDHKFLKSCGWEDMKQGVLVPIYDEEGNVVARKIRIKYSGKDKYYYDQFTNVPYGLQWLKNYEPSTIYITEGETDCCTMVQAGFPTLGIMSANDFQPSFCKYIEQFDRIIIIRDNDDAGWRLVEDISAHFPEKTWVLKLPNGVKDINNFHIFRCNAKIDAFKEKFNDLKVLPATTKAFIPACKSDTKLITDKDAWKIISKQLKNPMEQAIFIEEFAKNTGFGKRDIKSMLDDASLEATIRGKRLAYEFFEDDNCYFKTTMVNGVAMEKMVANFIIKPQYTKVTEDGDIRVVSLINKYGEVITTEFTPAELANPTQFDTKVASVGKNTFYGSADDLKALRDIIFDNIHKRVESPMAIGHLNDEHWVFGNCGIDKQGNLITIGEDNIIKLDNKFYLPRSISANDDGIVIDNYMPVFDLSRTPLNEEELKDFLFSFRDNMNSYNAWMGLGWCVANWYSDYVFKKHGNYPYLFVVGKKSQGKTTFCSWLNHVFGYSQDCNGRSYDNSTYASMSKALSYACSLPIWYDDYCDTTEHGTDSKSRLFLGAYNRQGGDRASRSGTGLDIRSVNATMLISGEYSPNNTALKSRCVTLIINGNGRDNTLFNKITHYFERLPMNALGWAAESRSNSAAFLDKIDEFKQFFEEQGIKVRTASNTAVFVAGFDHVFGKFLSSEEKHKFLKWAVSIARNAEVITEESHHIVRFFNDLGEMLSSTHSEFRYGRDIIRVGDEVKLKKSGTYRLWQDFQPSRRVPINEATLKSDLENEPYYCGTAESKYRFTTGHSHTWVFSYQKMRENGLLDDFCSAIDECDRAYTEEQLEGEY